MTSSAILFTPKCFNVKQSATTAFQYALLVEYESGWWPLTKSQMKLLLQKTIRLVVTASVLLGGQLAAAADPEPTGQSSAVVLSTPKVTNGNPLLVQIDTRQLGLPITDMALIFQERELPVFRHPANPMHLRYGLIGIPYRRKPGPAALTLKWTNADGTHVSKIPFGIIAAKYRTDVLKVDPARVNPSKKNIKRARQEARRLNRTYAEGTIPALWIGDFQLPMTAEITSPYGNRRVFNGQLKSYHNGVDFRAAVGTPVYASNSGIVKIAENLFYSGNAVIVDHGNLIFSIYAHLSQIKVKAGQQIERGQLLGLTGATGRVSGPHLHWGIKVNGTSVNPIEFVQVMDSLVQEQ
jgi:murein DD-endopeptidase MepM/ murein hydrolase activator NlpD